MRPVERQALDNLAKALERRAAVPGDFLGVDRVSCGACGRQIPQTEDRSHCLGCDEDYCLSCDRCCESRVRTNYPGFAETTDPRMLVDLARAHLAESLDGRFHVDDNIYFSGFKFFIDYLEDTVEQGDTRRADLGGLSPPVLEWLGTNVEPILRQWVGLKQMGRYVDYFSRRSVAGTLPDYFTSLCSQGMNGPVVWAGRPSMRTVWDFALAPMMVSEIKPRTIFELGTASGGATILYADLQQMNGLTPRVIGVDIDPPDLEYGGVTFLTGDSHRIEQSLSGEFLARLPHPWLVVEDAHQNIGGVLAHLDRFVQPGDYVIIEDVDAEVALGRFLLPRPNRYKVDTRYTDYFGHNATCAPDQILCCVGQ